jgi:isopenicillin-N N-acyltransferase-like protein
MPPATTSNSIGYRRPVLQKIAGKAWLRWFLLSALVLWVSLLSSTGQTCTLWAAAGDKVGGGTLIAKNRDWQPNHRQVLRVAKRAGEPYRYYGLYRDGDENDVKAGINERGLVVVNATAPFPAKLRRTMPRTLNLSRKILANCQSVEDALKHASWLLGPRFLLLADRRRIASIEIAPEGKFNIQATENGVLYHTNHYLDPQFRDFNTYQKTTSSLARFERISQFMFGQSAYQMKDFIAISASTDGGPNNSIWRTGKSPSATRTLAAWIVRLSLTEDPQLYVKIANPGEDIREYHLTAANLFNR